MRFFAFLTAFACGFSYTLSAYATNNPAAIKVIDQVSINGMNLSSSEEEIDAALEKFGEAMTCNKQVHAATNNRFQSTARRASWTCQQHDPASGQVRQLQINIVADRVSLIQYTGNMAPDFGDKTINEYIRSVHKEITAHAQEGQDLYYKTPDKSSPMLEHHLAAKYQEKCTSAVGHTSDVDVRMSLKFIEFQNQEHKSYDFSLARKHDACSMKSAPGAMR